MPAPLPPISFIVPAAGIGQRMAATVPKQYLMLAGKPILQHTLEQLFSMNPASVVLVVAREDNAWRTIPCAHRCRVVPGGMSRAQSVINGLQALGTEDRSWVLVHDCVRPCVSGADILSLIKSVQASAVGGLLGLPLTDTLKQVTTVPIGGFEVLSTVPRARFWLAQTPQMFRLGMLRQALHEALTAGLEVTDEASAIEHLGYRPLLVEGSKSNIKITTPEDLSLAEHYLNDRGRFN